MHAVYKFYCTCQKIGEIRSLVSHPRPPTVFKRMAKKTFRLHTPLILLNRPPIYPVLPNLPISLCMQLLGIKARAPVVVILGMGRCKFFSYGVWVASCILRGGVVGLMC